MPIDMDNDFRPVVGQRVRIVGNCHSRLVGCEATVVAVYQEDGKWYADKRLMDPWLNEMVVTCGQLGGLEPVEGLVN